MAMLLITYSLTQFWAPQPVPKGPSHDLVFFLFFYSEIPRHGSDPIRAGAL